MLETCNLLGCCLSVLSEECSCWLSVCAASSVCCGKHRRPSAPGIASPVSLAGVRAQGLSPSPVLGPACLRGHPGPCSPQALGSTPWVNLQPGESGECQRGSLPAGNREPACTSPPQPMLPAGSGHHLPNEWCQGPGGLSAGVCVCREHTPRRGRPGRVCGGVTHSREPASIEWSRTGLSPLRQPGGTVPGGRDRGTRLCSGQGVADPARGAAVARLGSARLSIFPGAALQPRN